MTRKTEKTTTIKNLDVTPSSARHRICESISSQSLEDKLLYLRRETIGRYTRIAVPDLWHRTQSKRNKKLLADTRPLIHLDYTASAQTLRFIESYILHCMETYANTHTESSATGRLTGKRVNEAIESLRLHVGAGRDSFILPVGFGATGAIEKLQNILGLYLSPRADKRIKERLGVDVKKRMSKHIVVFVGPSEHHSNDVSWQDGSLGHFVRIKAIKEGENKHELDISDLEYQLQKYDGYYKIASFSAASNVTGMRNDLKRIGGLLKKYNCLFLVDYAASGPYADINMKETNIDAIFLSAHKNIGGTNLGLLVAKNSIYDAKSHPSFAGGGTVSSVTPWNYHFHDDIQLREMAGTPGLRHILQAALSFEIKDWIGRSSLKAIEARLCKEMISFFQAHPKLELLGNKDHEKRYPIFSFIIPYGDRYLHHAFVSSLLNDAFGIQARSGCACAGPYGHELLGIDKKESDRFVKIIEGQYHGFKPGWIRLGTHYTIASEELDYIKWALSAVALFGSLFLNDYHFDPYSGEWKHVCPVEDTSDIDGFCLDAAINYDHQPKEVQDRLLRISGDQELFGLLSSQKKEFCQLICSKLIEYSSITQECFDRIENELTNSVNDLIAGDSYDLEGFFTKSNKLLQKSCAPNLNIEATLNAWRQRLIDPASIKESFESFHGLFAQTCFFYAERGSLNPKLSTNEQMKLG